MRRALLALAAMALLAVVVPSSPVDAQATTDVYVVHGLNTGGQSSPDDGGSNVTVCSGDETLLPDFQFGDVAGPVPLTSGEAVPIQVYVNGGEDPDPVDCADPEDQLVIDQTVTPEGAAVALVATDNDEGVRFAPELLPIPLDVSCVDAGTGRAVAVHSANAPTVDVVNTDLDASVGIISYGEQISGSLPVGTYGIEVFVVDGPPEPVLAFDFPVPEGLASIGYAVGGIPVDSPEPVPSPFVIIPQTIAVGTCAAPPPPPPPPAPPTTAAAATTAQPSFTG
jgi:hypothetical protein